MYNLFDNIEEFNTWHQAVKDALGFPLQTYNYGTGEPVEGVFVTAYTTSIVHPITGNVICHYREGDEIAASHEPKLSAQEAIALGYFPTPLGAE